MGVRTRIDYVPVGVAVVLVAMLLSACGGGSDSSETTTTVNALDKQYPPRVALFGDSLAWEAAPYFNKLVQVTGQSALTYDSHGGTAICDWLAKMREVADVHRPQAVELEFSGNALTKCMKGYEPGSDDYYAKYRADAEAAIAIFAPTGAHVYLIGAPITKDQVSDPHWARLNYVYALIAAADPSHVTYVDAGIAVEGPDHTYVETLPCVPVEPCTGPIVEDVASNVVRAPDGAHFCPVLHGDDSGAIGGCPVYSSGAFRYAYAMFTAIGVPIEAEAVVP